MSGAKSNFDADPRNSMHTNISFVGERVLANNYRVASELGIYFYVRFWIITGLPASDIDTARMDKNSEYTT